MNSTLEAFQAKFVDEALDNIEELEQALFALEQNPQEKELLAQIFRIMHSLKGGGAMFGFDHLSNFAHHLESMYDQIRSGTGQVNSSVLSVTFRSVDLLRDFLSAGTEVPSQILFRSRQLSQEINNIREIGNEEIDSTKTKNSGKSDSDGKPDNEMATWYIRFCPGEEVQSNGINLFYLLDELSESDNFRAFPRNNKIPEFSELHPETTYYYWDILLATNKGEAHIRDVFLFVEEDSQIDFHLISRSDLLKDFDFIEFIQEIDNKKKEFSKENFSKFTEKTSEVEENQVVEHEYVVNTSDNGYNPPNSRTNGSIRVSSGKIDHLMGLVSELVISQGRLNLIASDNEIPELKMVAENIQKLTTMLRDNTFSISLVPLDFLTTRFQRLVRDLGTKLGKKIDLSVRGGETELDKSMIDSLADPLLHIIRNAVDHGIETSKKRLDTGKSERGRISFEAEYSGANVLIKISDDGAGIDPRKVQQKAVEKKLISPDKKLSEKEMLDLLFLPGFSTSTEVTEISGRGVGMDVVRRNIETIRGTTTIESVQGQGTTISISLPLVLSIIDGLLVSIDGRKFVLPLSVVDRIFHHDFKNISDLFLDVVEHEGEQISFVNLRKELEIESEMPPGIQVVVIHQDSKYIGLSVDRVLGNVQAVLKPLGRLYHHQKMVSSATILGDGSIALVIDVNGFFSRLDFSHAR